MLKTKTKHFTVIGLVITILVSCGSDPIPKPRGFFRIELPAKAYKNFDGPCPFSFDIPRYSALELSQGKEDSCIFNIIFPSQNAKIYFTYLPITDDLSTYLDDAYELAYSHEVKASAIHRNKIERPDSDVHGMIYDLKGNVASSLQFYATDSSKHFVRGALYFNSRPNADSTGPVLDFLRADVLRMLNSLKWKKN